MIPDRLPIAAGASTAGATVDLLLQPAPPTVVQISPANHASQVDRSATVTVTFSKAIDAATITAASVQLSVVSGQSSGGVNARLSLSSNGTQLVITPTDLLAPNTVYQLTLTSAITDKHGNGLQRSEVRRPLGGRSSECSEFKSQAGCEELKPLRT